MPDVNIAQVVGASSLSEVSWLAHGRPQVRGAVTLLRGDAPALAYTYADAAVARAVAASPVVAVSFTEPRSTRTSFSPLLLRGRPRLEEDASGDLFVAELLEQELRRCPPARMLADSPLLRREHWWYLPRLLVTLDVESAEPIGVRAKPRDHLLVVANSGRTDVHVAGVADQSDLSLLLDVVGPVRPGPAVLFGQDASFPDLERWSQWRYRGHWYGDEFAVQEAPSRVGLGPVPGLVQRWRRQRELERRCRRGIASR